MKELSSGLAGKSYFLFFDNFFSSVSLLQSLQEVKLYCCCTTRQNRQLFPAELKDLTLKMGEHRRKMIGAVEVVVWKDKKNVSFLNNIYSQNETQVNRRQRDGSVVPVTSPLCAAGYNMHMGGVDLADQKRKAYTCSRKSEKWWFRLFWFLVDISVVNAHILSVLTPGSKQLTQKEFRLQLATTYLEKYNCRKRTWAKASSVPMPTEHTLQRLVNRRRRCRKCAQEGHKNRFVQYECPECDVGLHPECFIAYHT